MLDTGNGLKLAAKERGKLEVHRTVLDGASGCLDCNYSFRERETQQSSTLKAQADTTAFSLLLHLSHLCPRYDPAPQNNCDASIVKACSQ